MNGEYSNGKVIPGDGGLCTGYRADQIGNSGADEYSSAICKTDSRKSSDGFGGCGRIPANTQTGNDFKRLDDGKTGIAQINNGGGAVLSWLTHGKSFIQDGSWRRWLHH